MTSTDPQPLQLRDLTDGYRFVANCRCGYRAAVAPAAILAARPEAQYWTCAELAMQLRCTQCRRKLLDRQEAQAEPGLVRRRLALERPGRKTIAFQGGMILP